ncbi:hypothetical protein [uncultured Sulfitobacter sp.]|uniref:hypothetical protein n=1 Tax=uncultured Sulfitobacter sp. TaxID=191468 RepID=UPI0030D861A4
MGVAGNHGVDPFDLSQGADVLFGGDLSFLGDAHMGQQHGQVGPLCPQRQGGAAQAFEGADDLSRVFQDLAVPNRRSARQNGEQANLQRRGGMPPDSGQQA